MLSLHIFKWPELEAYGREGTSEQYLITIVCKVHVMLQDCKSYSKRNICFNDYLPLRCTASITMHAFMKRQTSCIHKSLNCYLSLVRLCYPPLWKDL